MSIKCNSCGAELAENSKFCVNCGATVGENSDKANIAGSGATPKKQQWLYIVSGLVIVAAAIIFYSVIQKPATVSTNPHAGMDMSGAGQGQGQAAGDPMQGAMGGIMRELAALKEQVTKDSTDFTAFMRLGDMYFQIGRFEQALDYYQGASRANSSTPEPLNQVMHCAFQMGKFDTALGACDKLLLLNPNDKETLYNKGAILASTGKKDEARVVWESLIKNHPNDPEAEQAENSLKQL